MDDTTAHEACALLWQARQVGEVLDNLPPALQPASREAGHAVQARLEGLAASPRAGWKIAATSLAGQAHINVDGPLAGRILGAALASDGATLDLTGNRMRVAEPEFAFRLRDDLPPRATPYTQAEVMAAVADLHLALEIPDSRFADFTRVGAAALIADDACARELVLGPAVTADWRALDLAAHPVTATRNGASAGEGTGAAVLGDPRTALTWLANDLSALGIGLRAGEAITTGTCMTPIPLAPGDAITADFGPLGAVHCRFRP